MRRPCPWRTRPSGGIGCSPWAAGDSRACAYTPLGLMLGHPQKLGCGEARQRLVACDLDEPLLAEAAADLVALPGRALIVPEDRGSEYLALPVEQDQPVHLPGQPDRRDLDILARQLTPRHPDAGDDTLRPRCGSCSDHSGRGVSRGVVASATTAPASSKISSAFALVVETSIPRNNRRVMLPGHPCTRRRPAKRRAPIPSTAHPIARAAVDAVCQSARHRTPRQSGQAVAPDHRTGERNAQRAAALVAGDESGGGGSSRGQRCAGLGQLPCTAQRRSRRTGSRNGEIRGRRQPWQCGSGSVGRDRAGGGAQQEPSGTSTRGRPAIRRRCGAGQSVVSYRIPRRTRRAQSRRSFDACGDRSGAVAGHCGPSTRPCLGEWIQIARPT